MSSEHGRKQVSVLIAPLSRAHQGDDNLGSIAIVSAAERPVPWHTGSALRAAFGLTAAEARMAVGLANGDSLSTYAASAGITIATARSNLKLVMVKTGTHRQAELVRLVLRQFTAMM